MKAEFKYYLKYRGLGGSFVRIGFKTLWGYLAFVRKNLPEDYHTYKRAVTIVEGVFR